MKINNNIRNWIKYGVLVVYIALMVYFLFFAEQFGRTTVTAQYRYNLTPFKEIKRFIIYYDQLGPYVVGANLLGNVAVFVPVGIFLPVMFNGKLRFVAVAGAVLMLTIMVELIQLISKVGSFDVDDIMLNTLGGIIGYLMYYVWKSAKERKKKKV